MRCWRKPVFAAFDILLLLVGIGLLYWGSQWLVSGSVRVARAFGAKALVIGLTVVAFGTSAPELAVATRAVLDHAQPIALGTVIGSCAANISLILGLTALMSPTVVDRQLLRREIPVLFGSSIAVPLCLIDGVISRTEGVILVGCAILFTIATLVLSARVVDLDGGRVATTGGDEDATAADSLRAAQAGASSGKPRRSTTVAVLLSAAGLALLITGASLFFGGARNIASELGMSERLVGMTVIALGTSTPELIMALVANARGRGALAVGAVIGSNIVNVFWVLGIVAYLRPIRVGERMHVIDLIGLVGITLLGIVTLRGGKRIARLEGAILVAAYIAFLVGAALL